MVNMGKHCLHLIEEALWLGCNWVLVFCPYIEGRGSNWGTCWRFWVEGFRTYLFLFLSLFFLDFDMGIGTCKKTLLEVVDGVIMWEAFGTE